MADPDDYDRHVLFELDRYMEGPRPEADDPVDTWEECGGPMNEDAD